MSRTLSFVVVLTLWSGSVVSAQAPERGGPDLSKVRLRLGPLWVNPTLAVTNAGLDTNVFNEPDQAAPKQDFTVTVSPATDLWLRLGRSWLSGSIKEDLVYYHKYAGERSANSSYVAGWRVPLNRVTFSASGSWLSLRERPGFEIDARSQRHERLYGGLAEVRVRPKTFVGVSGSHQKIAFDQDAEFLGNSLQIELNRTVQFAAVVLRHQLTPLTSMAFTAARQEDRFEFSPLRDSTSTMFAGSVALDPGALLKGSVSVGYREFVPLDRSLPRFKGATASIDLTYVVGGSTQFGMQGSRDVQYSYSVDQPYYVQTGVTGSIAQQLFGPVDVVGRLGMQRLDYRDRLGAEIVATNRVDYIHTYGAGVGYRVGRTLRLGVNVDRFERTTPIQLRGFNGLRLGTSVTYGL